MQTLYNDLIIKNAPTAVAIVDTKLNFISYSDLWLRNYASAQKEIRGKYLFDFIPETPIQFNNGVTSCLEGKEMINDGQKFTLANGKVKWLKWKISPWKNNSNAIEGLLIFMEDITEMKREIELLQKAESVAKIGSWEVDLEKGTVYWTKITKEIHEVSEDYIPNLEQGINFYKEGIHRDNITQLVSAAIQDGTPWDTELILVTAKGNELWVRALGEVERHQGKTVRLFGTFQDIDERKKADLEYKRVSERLKLATQTAKIGIWEFDVEKDELLWDENMYALYGVEKADFKGVYEAWEAGIHPEDKERGALEVEKAIAGEKEFDTEFRILWPNGAERHIKAIAKTIKHNPSVGAKLIGANWDITERVQAEKKLQSLVEVTKSQNESLMNFAHIVSHNLRSHSTNMTMLTEFLAKEDNPEERRNINRMINEAAVSLSETIAHLNDVVQVKTGALENLEPVSVLNTITQIQRSIKGLFEEQHAIVNVHVLKSHFVHVVPAYFESIVLNLLTNALKYSSPERTPTIDIKSKSKGDTIVISFTDNGQGIDMERHGDKIFGMYKTFHKHKDAKGIGLFITKNQIESMNGTIRIKSIVNKGTTVFIELKKG